MGTMGAAAFVASTPSSSQHSTASITRMFCSTGRTSSAFPCFRQNPKHRKWHQVLFRQKRQLDFFVLAAKANAWSGEESPYDVLGVELDADEDEIKSAYRRMAKQYHPDVYDGTVVLEEGETPETRFIKIQAAYELLIDKEQRRQYDVDHRVNPLKASKAWMEWMLKKKKAFEQRGDMAVTAWAEQQQRELNLKARRLSKYKMDPEEERRILSREKQASAQMFENTLRRHTLVLKKRDIMRRRAEENAQKKLVQQLLAAEGLELADPDESKND